MSTNPYTVLGVDPSASEEEIKKKYRALVKQYHPDLHPDDPVAAKKMSEINEAYEQIKSGEASYYYSDSSSQNSGYDHGSFTSTDSRRNSGTYSQTYYYEYENMDDLFGSFFSNFGFGTAASQSMDPEEAYRKILSHIERNELEEAASLLDRMVYRTAMWYYCAAQLSDAEGQAYDAVRFADTAFSADRSDMRFAALSAQYHKKYDKIIRRSRILPALVSGITISLAVVYLLRFLFSLFGWMIMS